MTVWGEIIVTWGIMFSVYLFYKAIRSGVL